MTDTNDTPPETDGTQCDWLTKETAYHQLRLDLRPRNKSALFEPLAAAGITRVVFSFDGYGDDGQIENIEAKASDETVALPDTEIEIATAEWGRADPIRSRASMSDAIERVAYDLLEDDHAGWENNGGAYGEFIFDVAARKITLDFNQRYEDSEHFEHTF